VSNVQCAACTRTSDGFLCGPCADMIVADLRQVGWISDELDVTLSRQDRIGAQQGGHKPGKEVERPSPMNQAAAAAAWDLHYTLQRNVAHLSEQRGLLIDCVDTAPALAGWLIRHKDALRHDEAAGEAFTDVRDVVRKARRVIDAPIPRQYLLVCGADTVHGKCPANLYGQKGRHTAICSQCQTTHDADKRREDMMVQARGTLGTPAELARLVRTLDGTVIDRKRIAYLVRLGKVGPRPSADGNDRYVLGEVLDALVSIEGEKLRQFVKRVVA